jgi:hypothetical protein
VARWTIKWLQSLDPEDRLLYAARLFWVSLVLGILSTIFLCNTAFERVLMAISWGAITFTAIDIIVTADVRVKEEEK